MLITEPSADLGPCDNSSEDNVFGDDEQEQSCLIFHEATLAGA
jgi:hypothetical protein